MKDLGEATYILGIKIYRDRSQWLLGLSQSGYIEKVLKRFSMQDSKRGFLLMSHVIKLSKSQCPTTKDEIEHMDKIPYASAIGSIMYVMLCTRPDVSYALSITSRFQSHSGECHWIAVKNILKYLRITKDIFLIYGGQEGELFISGYTDAGFQSDLDDFRSQSGFVFCLNGGAVSWRSSKQDTVANSTTEVEYIAASDAAKEVVWIKKFLFLDWVLFLALQTQWTSIVTIMGLLLNPRSPDHISDPNTYLGISTSFLRSLREEMLRYVEFILMTMLLIL